MKIALTGILLAIGICACSTTKAPSAFLQTDNAAWNRYLAEKIVIDVDDVSLAELFCNTPALVDLNIVVRPSSHLKSGMYEESFINTSNDDQEAARLERMRVSFHADNISRRDLLYQISRECKADMSWDMTNGIPRAVSIVFHKER